MSTHSMPPGHDGQSDRYYDGGAMPELTEAALEQAAAAEARKARADALDECLICLVQSQQSLAEAGRYCGTRIEASELVCVAERLENAAWWLRNWIEQEATR